MASAESKFRTKSDLENHMTAYNSTTDAQIYSRIAQVPRLIVSAYALTALFRNTTIHHLHPKFAVTTSTSNPLLCPTVAFPVRPIRTHSEITEFALSKTSLNENTSEVRARGSATLSAIKQRLYNAVQEIIRGGSLALKSHRRTFVYPGDLGNLSKTTVHMAAVIDMDAKPHVVVSRLPSELLKMA